MTAYKKFCVAGFEMQDHAVAIDKIYRELPLRLRLAISNHFGFPVGEPNAIRLFTRRGIRHVDVFQQTVNPDGSVHYEPCDDDHYLQTDGSGVPYFSIGIYIERSPGAIPGSTIFATFQIENANEQSIELTIGRIDGQFSFAPSLEGYAKAGADIVERLVVAMKDSPQSLSERQPIGFRKR